MGALPRPWHLMVLHVCFENVFPGVPPDVRSFIHVAPSAMTLADGPLPARTRAFGGGVRPLRSAAVISTNQFKNGTHIEVDGTIYRIVDFQHVKPGKGGAFVRTKLRRVDDGSVMDKTFRAGEKFRPVRTETRRMQYLYDSGDAAVFMDNRLRAARSRRAPART